LLHVDVLGFTPNSANLDRWVHLSHIEVPVEPAGL